MIPARRMLDEVIASLKTTIAPAIAEPYPKTQAYIAAVILEFVAESLEERRDLAEGKRAAVESLFADLGELARGAGEGSEKTRLAKLVETLHAERETLGEDAFAKANARVRRALREILDQDLKVVGGKG